MKSRNLLWWGLGAGLVAVAAFIVGWLVIWPDDSRDYRYGNGPYGMMGYGYGSSADLAAGPFGMMGGMMGGGYGAGMMGGSGMMGGGYGAGMMGGSGMMGGGYGAGMMGGSGSGYGMMGAGAGFGSDFSNSPLTLDQARDAAKRYLDYYGNSDLKVVAVYEFANDFYVRVVEQSSGAGAFELAVGRNNGLASPTPGPEFVWNTKYGAFSSYGGTGSAAGPAAGSGMMGGGYGPGMMGGSYGPNRANATTDMPLKKEDARDRAQKFLDRQFPGLKAGQPETFYGYYTLQIEKDGQPFGLVSVDGYYGQVSFQSWLGPYLSSKQF